MSRWRMGLVTLAVGLAACGGDVGGPPGAEPGWLTVELATAETGTGGLVLEFTGGTVDSVRVIVGYEAMARAVSPTDWNVLVVGRPIAAGALGTIHVPDVARAADYQVQVRQAAARGTWAQRDPQAFSVAVRAP